MKVDFIITLCSILLLSFFSIFVVYIDLIMYFCSLIFLLFDQFFYQFFIFHFSFFLFLFFFFLRCFTFLFYFFSIFFSLLCCYLYYSFLHHSARLPQITELVILNKWRKFIQLKQNINIKVLIKYQLNQIMSKQRENKFLKSIKKMRR